MPARKILILDKLESPWPSYLVEFFEETLSRPQVVHDSKSAGNFVDLEKPEIVFGNPTLFSLALVQKLKILKQNASEARLFQIGENSTAAGNLSFDASLGEEPSEFSEFQKKLTGSLPIPEVLQVLVVDDEPEIGTMVEDFFMDRTHPSFEVTCASNGKFALESIQKKRPDVIVLDLKMPVMDGAGFYRELKKRNLDIPVIVFFDSISGEEMMEVRKAGNPAVVEKGARQSAMPEMLRLMKKLIYFA